MDLVWLQKTWKLLAVTCGPLAATSAKHDAKLFAQIGNVMQKANDARGVTTGTGAVWQNTAAVDTERLLMTARRNIGGTMGG